MLIKDKEFYDSILLIINDKEGKSKKAIQRFFKDLFLTKEKYNILYKALNHSLRIELITL